MARGTGLLDGKGELVVTYVYFSQLEPFRTEMALVL